MAGIGRYGVRNGNATLVSWAGVWSHRPLAQSLVVMATLVSWSPGSITGCYGNLSLMVPWLNHWLLW